MSIRRVSIRRVPVSAVYIRCALIPLFIVSLLACELLLAVGCSDADSASGTSGARIRLETRVLPARDDATFTNAFGWSVSLSRVLISVGALYYFEGAPVTAQRPLKAPTWPALRLAFAHPGHYQHGAARGELLESQSFDLLSPPARLGVGNGVTGEVRSARFSFASPARGAFSAELSEWVVLVSGEASKQSDDAGKVTNDEPVRPFELVAAAPALGALSVEGCVLTGGPFVGDGVVTLRISPEVWLDQIDFSEVPVTGSGSAHVDPDSRAQRAFIRGLQKGNAYEFSYEPASLASGE